MKYLKLYEAFKSKGISNTLKFLKDKVGQNEVNKFIEGLKRFMDYSGFPIDKISDDDLKYMRGKNALSLRTGEDKVTNPKGIEFIKFWFSLEKGYLGYTGTGNKEIEFKKENTNSSTGLKSEEKFTDMELERIKTGYELKGEIWPVTNYNKLKTGDSVIGFYDHDRAFRRFGVGIVYVDTERRYYVLQDVADGSTPDGDSGYTRYGKRYSWFIYEPGNEMGGDHRCLHYYKSTSEELHYVEREDKEEETEEPEENPLNWNLPLDGLSLSKWIWGGDSIYGDDKLKEADFSLVLYYDKMTNPEVDAPYFEPVSDIKKGREEDKEGALALMTDDKIRKQNLERYISKLSGDLEISKEDLSNLGKILVKALLGEFSFISISQNRKSNLDRLYNICSQLYAIMSDTDSEYYIDSVKSNYKKLNEDYYKDLAYSLEIKSLIKGTEAEKIFNRIFELGTLISDLIRKQNAQSIDDLLILYQKISSIRNFIHVDQNRLSYYIRNMFSEFYSKSSFEYYLREFNDSYDDSNYQEDIKRLERVEKYIRSIL